MNSQQLDQAERYVPVSDPEAPFGGTASVKTQSGFFVAFDPIPMRARIKDPRAWWSDDPMSVPEREDGRLAVWPLSKRGPVFRFRVGRALTEGEQPFDRGHAGAASLVVTDGELFVGPVERLPGDGFGDRLSEIPEEGLLFRIPSGTYRARVHVLDWKDEEGFWTEENEPTSDAPVDFVVVLEDAAEVEPVEDAQDLMDLYPKKKPLGTRTVKETPVSRQRHRERQAMREAQERGKTKRGKRNGGTRTATAKKIAVAAGKPGELRVGCEVRHPQFGPGTVLFVKSGFPKAKVDFQGSEVKVDKSELTVLS